jgi:molybdate transport system substrate-binding protein
MKLERIRTCVWCRGVSLVSFAFLILVTWLLTTLGACKPTNPDVAVSANEDTLVIFAASSLRDVFGVLGEDFQRSHPGVKVTQNFAGTAELRVQLEHGARADVFASADRRHMDELVRAAHVLNPVIFARNEPVVVVATEAKTIVRSFSDLPLATRIVIGGPDVPIGRYTLQLLDRASAQPGLGADFRRRVEAKVVSRELNVRQVLVKVGLGEAQAGIVYRTDAHAAAVTVVPIPPEFNVIADYPIASVANAAHPTLARAWTEFVMSAAAQEKLRNAGFLPGMAGP